MDKNNISELVPAVNGTDDREARSKFWIAAYTRPKSEKKAASELSKFMTTYVATQTQIRQWSDRKKKIESVVIPMVIFAEVSSEDEIQYIKKHPLVLKILTLPGQKQAAHIPTNQVERLKFMLDESENPIEFISGRIAVSDLVRIIRGPLLGLECVVDHVPDGRTFIIVTIDILGGVRMSVNISDLEVIRNN